VANRKGYAGYDLDYALSGSMHHVRRRVLAGKLGRWLTRDPMVYRDGPNAYAYARSNPQLRVDPSGLRAVPSSVWPTEQGVPCADNGGGCLLEVVWCKDVGWPPIPFNTWPPDCDGAYNEFWYRLQIGAHIGCRDRDQLKPEYVIDSCPDGCRCREIYHYEEIISCRVVSFDFWAGECHIWGPHVGNTTSPLAPVLRDVGRDGLARGVQCKSGLRSA